METRQKRAYVKKPVEQRIEAAQEKSRLMLAKSMPTAVEKLTKLLEDANPETVRKACVDVIKLQLMQRKPDKAQDSTQAADLLDAELANRLLGAMTGERGIADGGWRM